MQADYSMVMPFLVKALLDNRRRYRERAEKIGMDALIAEDPHAKGYLRPSEGYRLFERRQALNAKLLDAVRANGDWLYESMRYPLAQKV
jgi:deoxyhypusine synthase